VLRLIGGEAGFGKLIQAPVRIIAPTVAEALGHARLNRRRIEVLAAWFIL
jgi:hypothetical protein